MSVTASVSASFEPDRVAAAPGQTAALSLHLHNMTGEQRMVKLRAGGGLATHTILQTETVHLDPNEHFQVPVIVDVVVGLVAGNHSCVVEIVDDKQTTTVAATIEIAATESWSAALEPVRSSSATRGRHKVVVDNVGNVPITVELAAATGVEVAAELAAPAINIDGGKSAKIELRATPLRRFWSGPRIEHPFSVTAIGSDREQLQLDGVFEQGPRVRPWLGPAAAGMVGALGVGAILWFALLRPDVESIATREAAELDTAQQAALDQRVAEIQAAADEASKLPLGEPTDLRLTASADAATSATESFDFDRSDVGRILSISDVIFQNPTGAVGRLELLRDDQVLLDQQLANFRDLDFHLVAPFRVESGSSISLRITCETPGPGTTSCEAAATLLGFVDDV